MPSGNRVQVVRQLARGRRVGGETPPFTTLKQSGRLNGDKELDWRELKAKGVSIIGGAASGGLDSCTATHWLSGKGLSVHSFIVDLGNYLSCKP